MIKNILLLSLLVCQSLAFWSACPGFTAPREVTSPQCTDRCVLTRGQTLVGNVWFTPANAYTSLNVFITADGTNIPISPPENEACNSLWRGGAQVSCPTVPNQEHEWRLNIPIPLALPPLTNANFRVELVAVPQLNTVVCFTAFGDLL